MVEKFKGPEKRKEEVWKRIGNVFLFVPVIAGGLEIGSRFIKPKSNLEIFNELAKQIKIEEVVEAREIISSGRDLTRQLNDIRAIREFFKPHSPIGMNDLSWILTIDAPGSRFTEAIASLTGKRIRSMFFNKMTWTPYRSLERLQGKDRYKIERIKIKVYTQEEREILLEILKDFIVKETTKHGEIKDRLIRKMLDNLLYRLAALAELTLDITNLNTGESLTLVSFGDSRIIGPWMTSYDRDLAIQSSIQKALDNLNEILDMAFSYNVFRSTVLGIAQEE